VLASLLLCAPLACQTCAECTLEKLEVRLCAQHLEEERAALVATRKQLASELGTERIAALDTLSRLTRTHVNAPSERVAQRIAASLVDESGEVREHAADLLGPPQHAILSMEALLEALSKAEKELRRLQAEEQDLRRKWAYGPTLREKQKEAVQTDLARNATAQGSLLEWRLTVVSRLSLFPDDRVVTTLVGIASPLVDAPGKARKLEEDAVEKWGALKQADERLPAAMDLNGALVQLGNRAALRTVVANLHVLQAEIADLEGWHTTLDGLRDMVKSLLRGLVDARDRSKHEIEDALVEKHLEVPLPKDRSVPWLLDWMEHNVEAFPEHLPGVVSPAW